MGVRAFAAKEAGGKLEEIEVDLPEMGDDSVEVEVEYCGICHSDLSMIDNEWQFSGYPLVAGHEVIGRISALGAKASKNLKEGDRVGIGWVADSCHTCDHCLDGYDNMCSSIQQTIVGRYGGFADKLRVGSGWAIPLPEALDPRTAGPMFCGGITVFSPLVEYNISPLSRVGVVGIGGLGHLALKFLKAWGCEVTAFTSSESKFDEAKRLGAHHVVNSKDPDQIKKIGSTLDLIIVTANANLDWNSYLSTLGRNGRLHFVGAVLEPLNVGVFSMLGLQRSVSASPVGKSATLRRMLDFASRHNIEPVTQTYKMNDINQAISDLRNGKARYRLVLDNTR